MLELEKVRSLLAKTTPGPWSQYRWDPEKDAYVVRERGLLDSSGNVVVTAARQEDCDWIAYMREYTGALVHEVEHFAQLYQVTAGVVRETHAALDAIKPKIPFRAKLPERVAEVAKLVAEVEKQRKLLDACYQVISQPPVGNTTDARARLKVARELERVLKSVKS